MATLFTCIAESLPGASLFGLSGPKDASQLQQEAESLVALGVIKHDVLGFSSSSTYASGKFEQRYYFIIPGIILSSNVSFDGADLSLRDAVAESWRGPAEGHSLDLTPTLIVEFLSPRVIRVRNTETESLPFAVPGKGDEFTPTAGELSETEDSMAINLHFQAPDIALEWAETLIAERDHIYLPTLVERDVFFCRAFHVALWKAIEDKKEGIDKVRALYFRCERGINSPEPLIVSLYNTFSNVVPKGQMSKHVDTFLEVLNIIVSDVPTRLFFLSWAIGPEFLGDFEAHYRQLLADAEAEEKRKAAEEVKDGEEEASTPAPAPVPATESSLVDFLQSILSAFSGTSTNNQPAMLLVLANFIKSKASAPAYAQNAALLPAIYGLDTKQAASPHSSAHAAWLSTLAAGKGSVAYPIRLAWPQARLLLEPGPYCGYFFVDYAVEDDDIHRARSTCHKLTYDFTQHFDAIHINGGSEEFDNAAHFVAYLEWDSLQRGYEEYELKNKGNRRALDLLEEARSVYSAPICTASRLQMTGRTSKDLMEDFIAQLLGGVEEEECKHIRCLRKVLGHWMSFSGAQSGGTKYEAPRKAHVITLLLLSSWLVHGNTITEGTPSSPLLKTPGPATALSVKALIGHVVEGEDRSLILAIAATDTVLTHGKKCHLLYSTADDLFRDFTRAKPYFDLVGISVSMNDFSEGAQITYCLQQDLAHFYREGVFGGSKPLADTLLFIHDLASFSVGHSPNATYGKRDAVLSAPFKEFIDVLAALPPTEVSDSLPLPPVPAHAPADPAAAAPTKPLDAALREAAWTKAKRGWAEFLAMVPDAPLGYSKVSANSVVLLDAQGKPSARHSLGLEVARHRLLPNYEPCVNSKFLFQSLPHVFELYDCTLALEVRGTEASEGHEFLARLLGAWTINIPNDEAQKNFAALLQSHGEGDVPIEVSTEEDDDAAKQAAAASARPLLDAAFSPVVEKDGDKGSSMSALSKGQMMNQLCERFYAAYPCSAQQQASWPSTKEHRALVQFLENDNLHDVDGVEAFAKKYKLASRGGVFGVGV